MEWTTVDEFRRALGSSKKILVLSGAGLSAASGIATYRGHGHGGLWRNELSPQTQFIIPSHYIIYMAGSAIPSIRHKLAPNSELTHVTQNVDGLCTKALDEMVADGVPERIVRRADLPHCPDCGQLCRPGVVWFGERPHLIHDILALADEADFCIIVGRLLWSNQLRRSVGVPVNTAVGSQCLIMSRAITLTRLIFSSWARVRHGLRKYWECRRNYNSCSVGHLSP
ncbi:hypothetical protein HYDPIDRAFT_180270 [Hydnomerulius pinastri MD-312]|nr:hypothetical protein HYDPIDRAFT_180270 [Hydnomerulius pinastri MD-312]